MTSIDDIADRVRRVRNGVRIEDPTAAPDRTRPEPDVEIDELEITRLHLHTRDGLDVRWRFDNRAMDGETHLEAERDCVADLVRCR